MRYYSYDDFKRDIVLLRRDLKEFNADSIVGIARGGLTLAHSLAEALDIRDVKTLRTELYDKTCKRDEISIFGDCSFNKDRRVLVVDDISDSGETLNAIMKYLKKSNQDIEFVVVTLFYKKTSLYEPDYWIHEADEWIEFFWEIDFKR